MAAAALGESLHGAGRNVRAFYYLYFGVGLGGSMVKDGVPMRGFYGNAGEIGHVPLVVKILLVVAAILILRQLRRRDPVAEREPGAVNARRKRVDREIGHRDRKSVV